MTKKNISIDEIINIAENSIKTEIPFFLRKIKSKPEVKTIFRRSYSEFYKTKFFVCKPFHMVTHMPFKNSYENPSK